MEGHLGGEPLDATAVIAQQARDRGADHAAHGDALGTKRRRKRAPGQGRRDGASLPAEPKLSVRGTFSAPPPG
eukprot:2935846-Prymnesium_polylepis.1